MYFDELDLNDNVLDALYDMHFDSCTPVQEKCIPEILKGNDVLGVAQTGTGKTAAYLLPILSKLDDGGYPKDAINCVIMSPTRELAQQIDQAMQGFGYYLNGVSSVAVYGGNDGNRYDQELKSLRLGADVVIATPGRLISHISLGNVDMSKVSYFVLDEADRMLDMGFSEDILQIAKLLPDTCQTIMFSATMPAKIEELAKTLLKNPVEIKLAVSKPAEKIKQEAYVCYETQKLGIIKDIFKAGDLKRVIIFCGSKMKVKQVNAALQRKHINCGEMHSDLEQAERDDIMFKFKSGQLDVLVATDIVARGIDIDDIAMVINYDVPHDAEDYVHRIGRTARADRDGRAITLVSEDDIYHFQQIEKFLEKEVEKIPLPADLGEAPEYARQSRPSKGRTTAKSRRRKDRDQQAHRHKPNNQRRPARPEQDKEREAARPANATEQSAGDKPRRNRRQSEARLAEGKPTEEKQTEGNPTVNRQPRQESGRQPDKSGRGNRNRRNAKSAGGDSNRNGNRPADAENRMDVDKPRRSNNHNRKRGNGRDRRQDENRTASSARSMEPSTPRKPEGTFKMFFKRILGIKRR